MLVKDVKEGMKVQCYGFSCIEEGGVRTVKLWNTTQELYIDCKVCKHFLEGQLSEDGTEYIGLMPVKD